MHEEILLLQILNQIKVFHWMTDNYAYHIILDTLYNSMSTLVDQYMESSIVSGFNFPNTTSLNIDMAKSIPKATQAMYNAVLKIRDRCNIYERCVILDDMLGALSKACYLLRMQ